MVRLQRYRAYEYKNKTHYKYAVNIPKEIVLELGWKKGKELDFQIENNVLKIRPTRSVLLKQVNENE